MMSSAAARSSLRSSARQRRDEPMTIPLAPAITVDRWVLWRTLSMLVYVCCQTRLPSPQRRAVQELISPSQPPAAPNPNISGAEYYRAVAAPSGATALVTSTAAASELNF